MRKTWKGNQNTGLDVCVVGGGVRNGGGREARGK